MKELFVKDLQKGQVIDKVTFGIRSITELKDKNSNTYFDVEIVDKTGILKGKIWADKLGRIDSKALNSGEIVDVSGVVTEFRGEIQITVHDMFQTKNFDLEDLVIHSERNIDEMWEELIKYVEKVEDKSINKLLGILLSKYGDKLKISPAAERLHHAYCGGLLEHILEMLGMMERIKDYYPEANFDLITAGVIFHDAGKTKEIISDGFSITRSEVGKLIGHLVLSLEIFLECVPDELEEINKIKIEHMILSHHGVLEYGSPVVPMTIEAIILHKLDDLSAAVRQFKRVIEESGGVEDSFSRKDWALGTQVYLK